MPTIYLIESALSRAAAFGPRDLRTSRPVHSFFHHCSSNEKMAPSKEEAIVYSCVLTANPAAALQEECSAEASEEGYFALAFGAVDFEQGKKAAGRCREASLNLRDPGARCCHCLSFPESPDWHWGWAWYLSFPFCSFWSFFSPCVGCLAGGLVCGAGA